ncbi:MAG: 16S rRNA processing protein RimM [Selenomonadaceae bacterium]|nr:16S rRNA processing protein RimM [Selenomonadaceae bacterium]
MENKIIIGKIGAVRGLNGELKLIPLTDFEDRFDNLKSVDIDGKNLQVDYVKPVGKSLVIRFNDYTTRESAQKLTGKLMKVDKSEAAPLAEGEFYTFDIIGLEVSDLVGNKLGVVTEVLKTGSNDVFVTKNDDGHEILIPALKSVIRKIDIENKVMLIDTKVLEEV